MRAIVVDQWTEPEALRVSEAPEPEAGPGQLVVDVRAAGVNFSDTLIVRGKYQQKPPFPFVPGAELAGVVRRVGEGVEDFEPGDRVFAAPGTGGFAERACLEAGATYPMPDAMSFEHAAALPIVYPTSYAGLVFRCDLRDGETLLVHAAAGGVGLAAVQIGVALGARVIGTAGGAEKLELVRRAGAAVALDYREEDFVERVLEETGGRGADVIYDSVGGDTTDRSLRCLAWNGRLLIVGFASGRIPEIKANRILLKNVAVTGVHWPAYAEHEPGRVAETFAALLALYSDGRIRPEIHRSYPLDAVPEALAELLSRRTTGKLLVSPSS